MARRFTSTGRLTGSDAGLPTGSTNRTMMVWYKTSNRSSSPANAQIAGYGTRSSGAMVAMLTGNSQSQFVFSQFGAGVTSPETTGNNGNWHCAIISNNGNTWTNYFDNDGGTSSSVSTGTALHSVDIGNNNTVDSPINGTVAEVAVWTGTLTADERTALFKGIPPNMVRPLSLLYYTPLRGDPGATTEPELSGNGLTLSATGVGVQTTYLHPPLISNGMTGSIISGSQSTSTLLLDTVTGVDAAYSLGRKLRAGYTGASFRVRRSSDNTEQDIGFTANGFVDVVSLQAFCATTNGFLVKLYDQSNNGYDLQQFTTGNQFQVVTAGVLTKNINGSPAAVGGGANSGMITGDVTFPASNPLMSIVSAAVATSTANVNPRLFSFVASGQAHDYDNVQSCLAYAPSNGQLAADRNSVQLSTITLALNTLFIAGTRWDGSFETTYKNVVAASAVASTGNFGTSGALNFMCDGWSGGSPANEPWQGYSSELFFGALLSSADFGTIQANVLNFYTQSHALDIALTPVRPPFIPGVNLLRASQHFTVDPAFSNTSLHVSVTLREVLRDGPGELRVANVVREVLKSNPPNPSFVVQPLGAPFRPGFQPMTKSETTASPVVLTLSGTLTETASAADTIDVAASVQTGTISETAVASDTIDAGSLPIDAALSELVSASDTIDVGGVLQPGTLNELATASDTADASVSVASIILEFTTAVDSIDSPVATLVDELAHANDIVDAHVTRPPVRTVIVNAELVPLIAASQTLSILINNVEYTLIIHWCAPANCWVMDIEDLDENPIVSGLPLVTGADLLAQYGYLKFGALLIAQTSNNADAVPTGSNLGSEGNLYIVT